MTTRLLAGSALAWAWMLASCGTQAAGGNPQFVQAFGDFDSPCSAHAPAATTVQHCIARVVLTNQGGEGYGHLTLIVKMKPAAGGSEDPPPVRCGGSIPDTPPGGHAQLVCNFDVPPGQTLTDFPVVQSIDFVGPSSAAGSGSSTGQILSLILTAATALLALAALIVVASGRRPSPVNEVPVPEPASRKQAGIESANAEYELPQLPR